MHHGPVHCRYAQNLATCPHDANSRAVLTQNRSASDPFDDTCNAISPPAGLFQFLCFGGGLKRSAGEATEAPRRSHREYWNNHFVGTLTACLILPAFVCVYLYPEPRPDASRAHLQHHKNTALSQKPKASWSCRRESKRKASIVQKMSLR